MARDLSNYDTTVFPENEYLNNLMESSKTTTELFIEDLAMGRYSGVELWDAYGTFIAAKKMVGIDGITGFGKSLHIPIRDGLIVKKREANGVVYIKK